jgi:hypothetical protein
MTPPLPDDLTGLQAFSERVASQTQALLDQAMAARRRRGATTA